eukprot:3023544-Prymnesium_polylepis.1
MSKKTAGRPNQAVLGRGVLRPACQPGRTHKVPHTSCHVTGHTNSSADNRDLSHGDLGDRRIAIIRLRVVGCRLSAGPPD